MTIDNEGKCDVELGFEGYKRSKYYNTIPYLRPSQITGQMAFLES